MSSTELLLLGITGRNSDASSTVTPPGSVNSSPLTPPASEKFGCNQSSVLDAFRRAQKFQLKDPWNSFDLHPGEYEQALEELALPDNCTLGSFVENKLRYDYLPGPIPRLIIRMPHPIHEVFGDLVTQAIQDQLDDIMKKPEARNIHNLVKNIQRGRSTTVKLFEGTRRYQQAPDSQFWHEDARYPNVVLEISYSQKFKNLPRIADNYIVDSAGSIGVVIGLDIEYERSRQAAMFIWRPKIVDQGTGKPVEVSSEQIEFKVFRNDDGSVEAGGLRLQIQDFVPRVIRKDFDTHDLEQVILIPFAELGRLLEKAEKRGELDKSGDGIEETYEWGMVKRKRDSTPPEELSTDDEERFEDDRLRQEERGDTEDENFVPSSRKSRRLS